MGLLHVASFGQMCPLFAAISNLRPPHCLLALQLASHPDLSKSHKADIDNHHFPPLTINDDEDDGSVNYNDDFDNHHISLTPEREKVCHRGIGDESQTRAL